MSTARNTFVERCLAVGLGLDEWRLAAALDLCVLGFWDKDTGAYKTHARLGEALLRSTARLDGRSFQRAREGLIAKGLLRFEPPEGRGRGVRALYAPNVQVPAQGRGFEAESPAGTPAQSPAEGPALARGRMESTEEEAGKALANAHLGARERGTDSEDGDYVDPADEPFDPSEWPPDGGDPWDRPVDGVFS